MAGSKSGEFEKLLQLLKHKKIDKRWQAAVALGRLGDPRALNPLTEALVSDEAWQVRCNAANGLAFLGNPEGVEPLIKALAEEANPDVRERIVFALGELMDTRAIEPLRQTLRKDESMDVRRKAAAALGHFRGQAVEDALITACAHRDWKIRAGGVEGLGEFGDHKYTRLLRDIALSERERWVQKTANKAIVRIGIVHLVRRYIRDGWDGLLILRQHLSHKRREQRFLAAITYADKEIAAVYTIKGAHTKALKYYAEIPELQLATPPEISIQEVLEAFRRALEQALKDEKDKEIKKLLKQAIERLKEAS